MGTVPLASGAGIEPALPAKYNRSATCSTSRSCVLPCRLRNRGAIQLFWRSREKESSKNLDTIAIWDAAYYATRLRGISKDRAPLPCTCAAGRD